jgi:Polyketide cyclase / dehydrase and lipid transport
MGNLVHGSRDTSATCDTVWDLLADVDRWPETFARHLKRARLDGPLEPGATAVVENRSPPTRTTFTVHSVSPGSHFAWSGTIMGLTIDFDHRCEPIEAGCRVVFDIDLDGPLAGLVRPLVRPFYEPKMQRALDLLIVLAEGTD